MSKKKYFTEEERLEANRLYGINWRKNNPDYTKQHYLNNIKDYKKKHKKYYKDNKEKILKQEKEYRQNNLKEIKEKYIKHHKENPHLYAWRGILSSCLRRLNQKKGSKTIKLLGYSASDLKQHIHSLFTDGMSWNNYGEWHVDHIKKISEFTNDTHPSIVNALSNLRPLWATTREINGVVYEGNLNRPKVS